MAGKEGIGPMPFGLRYARQMSPSRRSVLQMAAGGGVAMSFRNAFAQGSATPAAGADIPITGELVAELTAFDDLMLGAMATWGLPGGQLAIAREDRLVLNRGYGFASVEDGEPVETDALFRIASSSKPITAVAILKLIDAGEITLHTPVFPLLAYDLPEGALFDERLDHITVEHLLVHAGGWNSEESFDPQYLPWPLYASHTLGEGNPADAETIVRFMLTQPLDFDPGTQSAYSNFGFNVLGRVIEKVSGQTYEQYVVERVLAPAGITSMAIGGTTLDERLPGEVRYYAPEGLEPRPGVYPESGFVPVGYGSFYLRSLDAHGGWVASAENLVRFALAIDGTKGEALLTPETVTAMETTPRPPAAAAGVGNVEESLGLGWNSVQGDDGYEWSHAGALEGSNCSWIIRKPDGTTLAFVFNTLPMDFGGFFGELLPSLHELMDTTIEWPGTDLFS
jgi:N-acyl-D-amino-acid deacylase